MTKTDITFFLNLPRGINYFPSHSEKELTKTTHQMELAKEYITACDK